MGEMSKKKNRGTYKKETIMKKKFIASLLVVALLATLLAGCQSESKESSTPALAETPTSSTGESKDEAKETKQEREILEYDTVFVISKERVPDDPSMLDEVLKEKFGIVMNWEQIASSSVDEKMNLLFASKDIPDMVWPVGVGKNYPQRYGRDGFLIPLNEHFDQLPNYRALYTDSEWEAMLLTESNADGNLYFLPQVNYRDTANAWIYRKSAFDEMGLEFPTTTEELYDLLTAIKAADPDSIPLSDQGGLNVLNGLYLAWGIARDSFINQEGEFIPYGRVTEEYREVLQYTNKLWEEGLINKEFATATEQQWTEIYANGKPYIQYLYATRVPWAEENMKAVDPTVEFAWTSQGISAPGVDGYYYNKEAKSMGAGPFFTIKMEGEKFDRILGWYDWISTDEGSLFNCMGLEGETYEIVDGEPRFMSHMYHMDRNPDGEREWQYGLYLGFIRQHEAYLKESGKATDLILSEELQDNPDAHAFPTIAWTYSETDEKKINDLDVAIKDVADEYAMKFIMGNLDPASDTDWDAYLKVLEGVGLEEASELRRDNYMTTE